MALESQSSPQVETLSEKECVRTRRAFLTGSLAAAPVITTLASRPAWAGCGMVSVMNSLTHASHADPSLSCASLPAETWRMDPGMIEQEGLVVGPPNPLDYSNLASTPTDYRYPTTEELAVALPGQNQEHGDALLQYLTWLGQYGITLASPPFGTKFNDIFGPYTDPGLSIMQALWNEEQQLLCQTACAWLNASKFGKEGFGYDPDDVVEHFQTTGMTDPVLLVGAFTAMNTGAYA